MLGQNSGQKIKETNVGSKIESTRQETDVGFKFGTKFGTKFEVLESEPRQKLAMIIHHLKSSSKDPLKSKH